MVLRLIFYLFWVVVPLFGYCNNDRVISSEERSALDRRYYKLSESIREGEVFIGNQELLLGALENIRDRHGEFLRIKLQVLDLVKLGGSKVLVDEVYKERSKCLKRLKLEIKRLAVEYGVSLRGLDARIALVKGKISGCQLRLERLRRALGHLDSDGTGYVEDRGDVVRPRSSLSVLCSALSRYGAACSRWVMGLRSGFLLGACGI